MCSVITRLIHSKNILTFIYLYISHISDMFRPKVSAFIWRNYKKIEVKYIKLSKSCDHFCVFVISHEDGTKSRPKYVDFMGRK